jgi:hypothetical protein
MTATQHHSKPDTRWAKTIRAIEHFNKGLAGICAIEHFNKVLADDPRH